MTAPEEAEKTMTTESTLKDKAVLIGKNKIGFSKSLKKRSQRILAINP